MKTIEFISASIEKMHQLQIPAQIQIGTFIVNSSGSLINWAGKAGQYNRSIINFMLQFRPDHIQKLLDLGVKIKFDTVKMSGISEDSPRFKAGREAIKQGRYAPYYYKGDPSNRQTGVIENWLIADASCDIETLKKLDKFCRDNHRDMISVHNDTHLAANGWKFREKYPSFVPIESQYKYLKEIRRTTKGKPKEKLFPIQKRVLNIL